MTVAELISFLKSCDQEMQVLVKGYETGFDSAVVETTGVRNNPNAKWYDGAWQWAQGDDAESVIVIAPKK